MTYLKKIKFFAALDVMAATALFFIVSGFAISSINNMISIRTQSLLQTQIRSMVIESLNNLKCELTKTAIHEDLSEQNNILLKYNYKTYIKTQSGMMVIFIVLSVVHNPNTLSNSTYFGKAEKLVKNSYLSSKYLSYDVHAEAFSETGRMLYENDEYALAILKEVVSE